MDFIKKTLEQLRLSVSSNPNAASDLIKPVSAEQASNDMLRQAGIVFPTPRPVFKMGPDEAGIKAWLDVHNHPDYPKLYQVANKLVENLNHIRFDQFIAQLQYTVDALTSNVKSPMHFGLVKIEKKN